MQVMPTEAIRGGVWRHTPNTMNYHLAILTPGWIDLILDGKKTIESRFTKVRCTPFGKVHEGDVVYLKESGGLVKGVFTIAGVETFGSLNTSGIQAIYERCGQAIFYQAFTQFFPPEKWLAAKHATLIHIANPIAFDNPFSYRQKGRSAWLLLDAPLHLILTCRCVPCDFTFETPIPTQLGSDIFKGVCCPQCGNENPNAVKTKNYRAWEKGNPQ